MAQRIQRLAATIHHRLHKKISPAKEAILGPLAARRANRAAPVLMLFVNAARSCLHRLRNASYYFRSLTVLAEAIAVRRGVWSVRQTVVCASGRTGAGNEVGCAGTDWAARTPGMTRLRSW